MLPDVNMRNHSFFWCFLLLVQGVFSLENYDVTMSVMEENSVTLNSGYTKILEDDTIQWWFKGGIIASLNKAEGDDAGFKGRLQLDSQTGSLTITNITTTDSGIYKLLIKSKTEISKTFNVTVHGKYDVTVSVLKGSSVPLIPGDTKIPEKDTIQWWFNNDFIAQMNKATTRNSTSEGDNLGFKGRLQLDSQTGSLTITNITTTDNGIYKLLIKSRNEISKTFKVNVHDDVELLSVMTGDPITLYTEVTIQGDDQIKWKFEDKVIPITHLNGPVEQRWRNIHLMNQTGNLIIRNIQSDQSGVYIVEINTSSMILHKKFHVNVSEKHWTDREIALTVVLCLVLVAIIAYLIYICYNKYRHRNDYDAGKRNGSANMPAETQGLQQQCSTA